VTVRSSVRSKLVAAGAAVLTTAGCALLVSLGAGEAGGAVRPARTLGREGPPRFVAVVQGAGGRQSLGLFSAATGARVKRLGSFGMAFTDNGLAVTPTDSAVFFTLIPRHGESLKLVRLDVASGRRTVVARGQQPAVDNAGTRLAFMTGRGRVQVRDLHSKARRELNIGRLLGFEIDPLNSMLVWLADEQSLVMLPAEPAIPVSVARTPTSGSRHRCRPEKTRWPIVFIHVPRDGAKLTARCRTVRSTAADPAPQPAGGTVLAASPTDPSAVWIASFNGPSSTIQQVGPTGPAHRVATLGRGVLPEAIDRASRHILYISGHPPALWEATIDGSRLTHRHRLVAHSRFATAAW